MDEIKKKKEKRKNYNWNLNTENGKMLEVSKEKTTAYCFDANVLLIIVEAIAFIVWEIDIAIIMTWKWYFHTSLHPKMMQCTLRMY